MGKITAYVDKKTILTAKERRRARDTIYNLRYLWIERSSVRPIFTLFSNCYNDARRKKDVQQRYLKWARKYNPVLEHNFSWLYKKVFARLSEILGGPILTHSEFALPGFHVFAEKNGFFGPDGNIHYDFFHFKLNWKAIPGSDPMTAITFTLPIILPKCGSRLHAWGMSYAKARILSEARGGPTTLEEILADEPSRFIDYVPGRILWQKGFIPHKVEPLKGFKKGDVRITFQGHAVRAKDGWVVYW